MKSTNDYLKVEIKIKESKWNILEEDLFSVVIRKNKKRHFLFASKVLGKYIAVHPYKPLLAARVLGAAFCEEIENTKVKDLEELLSAWRDETNGKIFERLRKHEYTLSMKTLMIGFAETATGIGHGMMSCFGQPVAYLHTTRANLVEETADLIFEEVHSHSVGHECFIKEIELSEYERVVLIDDEITTGNTALNLIEAIYKKAQIKEFVVASLLDWRSEKEQRRFEALEEKLGIRIQCVSLLKGSIETELLHEMDDIVLNNEEVIWKSEKIDPHKGFNGELFYETIQLELGAKRELFTLGQDGKIRALSYLTNATGRFGIDYITNRKVEAEVEKLGRKLKLQRKYKHTLCLGAEEFIYIPNLLASYMGEGVQFECSARSPIITLSKAQYALKDALCFLSPEDEQLPIYLYNMKNTGCEEIFWFLERDVQESFKRSMAEAFVRNGIKYVHFVIC